MRTAITVLFLFVFYTHYSSAQRKYYGIIGYGGGVKTYSKAYTPHYGNPPDDISSLDFANDRMFYSNWNLRMGLIEKDYFSTDIDITGLFSSLMLIIYEAVSDKSIKPNSYPGVGKLRKVDKNLGVDATGFGYGSDVFTWEFAVGADGWHVGASFGYSLHGTDDFGGINQHLVGENDLIRVMGRTGMGHLGLGLHKVLGDEDQMSVISFRVNRLRFRTYGNYLPDKAKRRGLEIHPSARLFFGDRYGLYLEAFYKFQLFKPFNTDVTWNYNFSGETGTLPGSNSHVFGINLGFFMPYAN